MTILFNMRCRLGAEFLILAACQTGHLNPALRVFPE